MNFLCTHLIGCPGIPRALEPEIVFSNFPQQVGIELKINLRLCFGNYGGLKLECFRVVKSKKSMYTKIILLKILSKTITTQNIKNPQKIVKIGEKDKKGH